MYRMPENTRSQKQYDHRLRLLIQNTGDLDLAVRYGVPRSTARAAVYHNIREFNARLLVAASSSQTSI